MAVWLGKTEPFKFSWDDLVRQGSTFWDGVRSAQARNNRQATAVGDEFLLYNSNEGLAVVGLARVIGAARRDPSADEGDDRWVGVDIAPIAALPMPVTLKEIKADPALMGMAFVRQGRLSVSPVTEAERDRILALGGLDLPPAAR
jgi:predicted RNA-binding protein with PUA-like domain